MNCSPLRDEIASTAPPTVAGSPGQSDGADLQRLLVFPLSVVITEDGLARPHFRCCRCGKTLTDASHANLVWQDREPEQPVVVCKGCDHWFRASGFNHWIPLNVAMLYLLNNTKVDMKSTNREAYRLSLLRP